jgi:hypothetical protein
MAGATRLLAATTLAAVGTSVWLYLDNRALRSELGSRRVNEVPVATAAAPAPSHSTAGDPWQSSAARTAKLPSLRPAPPPALAEAPKESRLERRQRRLHELSAMFGRHDGETEDEYRARVSPLIAAGLAVPRMRVAEYRRIAETQAGVTPEQSQQLDEAFTKVYDDVLDYTNKAIADGLLSPYERNVAGWLEYAGGLGTLLGEAQGQIGQILTPAQLQAMSDAGFEWGEYLGANAPWEKLDPPPPPPR